MRVAFSETRPLDLMKNVNVVSIVEGLRHWFRGRMMMMALQICAS
jgi:hypothetical protein